MPNFKMRFNITKKRFRNAKKLIAKGYIFISKCRI